jgi:predicted Ser/Thr protein kinase
MFKDNEQTQDPEATQLAPGNPDGVSPPDCADSPSPEELSSLLPAQCYKVECLLGRGGMGTVYRGTQLRLRRPVAIKIMRRKQANEYDFEQRFHREAVAMGELNHPNIVSVIDYGEAGPEYLYIVMEFVNGTDLMEVIRSGRMTQELALLLLPQICDALQFAHDRGIVHRDIKPSNILLTHDRRIKMADFGLVKRCDAENTFVTLSGVGMGTPAYAAPEQFDASSATDHRADIYALGVMMYQMLTGHLPRGAWRPPSQHANVFLKWDDIVSHAIQADPRDRYQSASEIKKDISTISPGGDASLKKAATRPYQWRRLSIAGAIVVGTAGTIYVWTKYGIVSNAASKASAPLSVQQATSAGYNVIKIGARPADLEKRGGAQAAYDVVSENGVLTMGKTDGKGQIYDYRPLARDAILRAEVRFDPTTSSPQLCLRNQSGGRNGTFYRLWSDIQDRSLKLAFVEGWNGYTVLQQWKLPAAKTADEWTALELRTIGDQITAVVDGHVLGTFTHDGIPKAGGYQIFTLGRADFRHPEYIILDPPPRPSNATRESMFVNSLGMKFVPVPVSGGAADKKVLFSIWETRERDYDAFVRATRRQWTKDATIDHGPDLPATSVSWDDAVAFCTWLSEQDRRNKKIGSNETYRLPTDHEWSCAIGIGPREDASASPLEKRNKIKNIFPWGDVWPPPSYSGNFWSEELRPLLAAGKFPWVHSELAGYHDGHATLAPVGSYPASQQGLYDLGGNVTEWCADWYDANKTQRVARGSEWSFVGSSDKHNNTLLSSYRFGILPELRQSSNGFRIVLDLPKY